MNSFFDIFRWDRFVAPSAIELLFWLLATVFVLGGGFGVLAGVSLLSTNDIGGLIIIALSVIGGVAGIVVARVVCEAVVILFRVNENLLEIASREPSLARPEAVPQLTEDPEVARLERRLAESRQRAAAARQERREPLAVEFSEIEPRSTEAETAESRRAASHEPPPERKSWDVRSADQRRTEAKSSEPRSAEPRSWDVRAPDSRPDVKPEPQRSDYSAPEPRTPDIVRRVAEAQPAAARSEPNRPQSTRAQPTVEPKSRGVEARLPEADDAAKREGASRSKPAGSIAPKPAPSEAKLPEATPFEVRGVAPIDQGAVPPRQKPARAAKAVEAATAQLIETVQSVVAAAEPEPVPQKSPAPARNNRARQGADKGKPGNGKARTVRSRPKDGDGV